MQNRIEFSTETKSSLMLAGIVCNVCARLTLATTDWKYFCWFFSFLILPVIAKRNAFTGIGREKKYTPKTTWSGTGASSFGFCCFFLSTSFCVCACVLIASNKYLYIFVYELRLAYGRHYTQLRILSAFCFGTWNIIQLVASAPIVRHMHCVCVVFVFCL